MINDPYAVKQALETVIDFVYEHQNDPPSPPEPNYQASYVPIEMPTQLASQLFIVGDAGEIFIDNDRADPSMYVIAGTTITPNVQVRTVTIVTAEARWQWDYFTGQWFITGINPDFFYKLREALKI